jgi:hypothetical protein
MFGIDDAVTAVSNLASTVVTRVWPDATALELASINKVTLEMQNEYNLILGQIEVNKIEAASEHWFIAGWRPFVGWVSATALAYSAILEPILRFIAEVCFRYVGHFPVIDTNITLQVLMGMLGFGAMRTAEKHLENKLTHK